MEDVAAADEDYWAGGRLAHITQGPWAGRLLFLYPDSREPWWTYVVDPSPLTDASGDFYANERDLPARLTAEWGLRWIPRSPQERELESNRFDWRRSLTGTSWLAPPPPTS